jgi:hypothetical protein
VKDITTMLYRIIKEAYRRAPLCFRLFLKPLKLVFDSFRQLRLELWVVEGNELLSSTSLRIVFAGRKTNLNYLANRAFGQTYSEKYVGRIWLWQFFKKFEKKGSEFALICAEVPQYLQRFFENGIHFFIPCWISTKLDISGDLSSLFANSSLKSDLRRIRSNGLQCEITQDISCLDKFYHDMYVPFVIQSHGNEAFISSLDFIKNEFKGCELMLITSEKQIIAGGLIKYTKDGAQLWYHGVRDGNLQYGAAGALYYFSIIHLKKRNFKNIGLGRVRALLRDGVLRYKKKWGMRLGGTTEFCFVMKPLIRSEGVTGFFLNNPFICLKSGKFYGVVFAKKKPSHSDYDFTEIYEDCYLKGMSQLLIYCFDEQEGLKQESVPLELKDKIVLHSAGEYFTMAAKC